ncbi:acetoin utilization AcuB family protein [Bacillus spongiae]|uniref:Acetoin utilization AcuB family protein n=1 Tax=Bacillus spongiae TaxID=2683610 RepID=A0ABU8HI74_9BACI
MIVEQVMKTNITVLTPEDTIQKAIEVMRAHSIRHIPICTANKLVGIISDRDVKEATPSTFNKHSVEEFKKPLKQIMTTNVITGHPLDFVEEVAALFYEYQISCLPIVKEDKLVGIITETDLLHTLIELTGAHQPGSHFEVKVQNKAGMLFNVVRILNEHNVNIHSVLVYPDSEDEKYKILVFRIQTMNPLPLLHSLKKEGHIVLWPNMPGVTS